MKELTGKHKTVPFFKYEGVVEEKAHVIDLLNKVILEKNKLLLESENLKSQLNKCLEFKKQLKDFIQ